MQDFQDPKTEYIQSLKKISIKKLAEKWETHYSTLRERSFKEKWMKQRNAFQAKAQHKMVEKATDALAEFNAKTIERMTKIIESSMMAATCGQFDNAKQAADTVRESSKTIKDIVGETHKKAPPKIRVHLPDGTMIAMGEEADEEQPSSSGED